VAKAAKYGLVPTLAVLIDNVLLLKPAGAAGAANIEIYPVWVLVSSVALSLYVPVANNATL
jgi:hypothetical protein